MSRRNGQPKVQSIIHAPRLIFIALVLFFLLSGCNPTATPPPEPVFIRIAGSTSMRPLLVELAYAYKEQQPNITFDIQGGGSALGYQLAKTQQIEIGMISGPVDALSNEVRLIPVARDAIAVVLHPQNKLAELLLQDIADIFSGRHLNWQAIDGIAAPIQVVSREGGSGTRAVFEAAVMDDRAVTLTAVVLPSSQAVVDFVAQNPGAIGYVSAAFVDDRVYAAPINGVAPTPETLAGRSYAITRDLALVTAAAENTHVNAFIEFVLSPAGQAIVAKQWGTVIDE